MAQYTGDYYKLLGLPRDAPDREVKRAYYKLARDLHPDKARSDEERAKNADALASISQAYNTLKDPRKRAEYDASRGYTKASGGPAAAAGPIGGGEAVAGPAEPAPLGAPRRPVTPAKAPAVPQQAAPPGAPRISQNDIMAQRKSMAQKAFVRGMQYFKRQELKEALPLFEAAVTQDPESEPQYHLKFAQCLMRTKGSYSRAVTHAQLACEMDQYNIDFKLMLAEIHETAGATSKAIEVYEDVLRWDPTNAMAKLKLDVYSKGGKGSRGKALLAGSQSALGKLFPSLFNKK
jgi:curved DNA-binding protein CbpA